MFTQLSQHSPKRKLGSKQTQFRSSNRQLCSPTAAKQKYGNICIFCFDEICLWDRVAPRSRGRKIMFQVGLGLTESVKKCVVISVTMSSVLVRGRGSFLLTLKTREEVLRTLDAYQHGTGKCSFVAYPLLFGLSLMSGTIKTILRFWSIEQAVSFLSAV